MIICESSEYQTRSGIHIGMTIQELRKIYPNLGYELIQGINKEIGYFIPSDLVLRNEYGVSISHVRFKLSAEITADTTITSIIVGIN